MYQEGKTLGAPQKIWLRTPKIVDLDQVRQKPFHSAPSSPRRLSNAYPADRQQISQIRRGNNSFLWIRSHHDSIKQPPSKMGGSPIRQRSRMDHAINRFPLLNHRSQIEADRQTGPADFIKGRGQDILLLDQEADHSLHQSNSQILAHEIDLHESISIPDAREALRAAYFADQKSSQVQQEAEQSSRYEVSSESDLSSSEPLEQPESSARSQPGGDQVHRILNKRIQKLERKLAEAREAEAAFQDSRKARSEKDSGKPLDSWSSTIKKINKQQFEQARSLQDRRDSVQFGVPSPRSQNLYPLFNGVDGLAEYNHRIRPEAVLHSMGHLPASESERSKLKEKANMKQAVKKKKKKTNTLLKMIQTVATEEQMKLMTIIVQQNWEELERVLGVPHQELLLRSKEPTSLENQNIDGGKVLTEKVEVGMKRLSQLQMPSSLRRMRIEEAEYGAIDNLVLKHNKQS